MAEENTQPNQTEGQTQKPSNDVQSTQQDSKPNAEDNTQNTDFNSEEFIKNILDEVNQEEKQNYEKVKGDFEEKLKGALKESIKASNDKYSGEISELKETITKQNEIIDSLQKTIGNQSQGSQAPNQTPQANPFVEKKDDGKRVVDVHSDEFKKAFAKKFGIKKIL